MLGSGSLVRFQEGGDVSGAVSALGRGGVELVETGLIVPS